MIISFINHYTPNATISDIEQAKTIFSFYGYNGSGYFLANNGLKYCYHFFSYSMLGSVVYIILDFLKINIKYIFYIYNSLLMIFMIYYILYITKYSIKLKIIIIVLSTLNPVLLYINWSHPEVYICFFISWFVSYFR